ncbi:MAG: hypothetical protein IT440_13955 [Phycisphaeraceae bacterium]|nr:hypothetical protein [Phycisphaeraceae bacterium]
MAINFTPRHIASPQLLGHVRPRVLHPFLSAYRAYFTAEKVMPPSSDTIDYDRLSLVLASPSEIMPAQLMADLFYWDEVAEMAAIEDLNDLADKHGIAFHDDITIEEAALLVRMKAPEALEDLHATYHAHGLLRKKKRFLSYFATVTDLPKWHKPAQMALDRFSSDMDGWYEGQKKGRGVRVSVIEKDDAAWFIVRHGGTFKRENAVENGEPTLVFYRPEAYDLLIYYPKQGELAIYNEGNSKCERQAYCKYLGEHLFGNDLFFERQDAAKYTLEPLRRRGRSALDCTDVPGLRLARLTYLRYHFNGGNNHSVTHKAEDVFTGLEDLGDVIPEGAVLVCMGVTLTPDSALGGDRNVKLYAPNVSVYDHERDADVAHRFLAQKGFILTRRPPVEDN